MKPAITLFFLFFTLLLSAQYEKGNWYLDGTTSVGYQRSVGKNNSSVSYFAANAFRAGYFFTDRLLVGSNINFFNYGEQGFIAGQTSLQFRPFVRYYFPGGDQRRISFFAEGGFGTISLFTGASAYETDFNFGGGAEMTLQPGILGTALLRYDANASGLNLTNLTFGFNVLLGQLENAGAAVSLSEGTFTTRARLGGVSYGRMSSNGLVDETKSISLAPWIGFFVTDRLMVEGGLGVGISSSRNEIEDFGQGRTTFSSLSVSASINLRYYLRYNGKLLPYVLAGGGFSFSEIKFENPSGVSSNSTQAVPFRIGVGTTYFLSPALALDASLAYDRLDRLEQLPFNAGFAQQYILFNAGFRFFLPK